MSKGKPLPFLLAGAIGIFVLAMAGAFVTTTGAFKTGTSRTTPRTTNVADRATSTPTPPPPTPTPTPQGPPSFAQVRLWAGGDSLAAYVASNLVTDAKAKDAAFAADDWKVSSGLSRPDFFDWLAELQQIIAADNPNVMVFMAGANDAQGLTTAAGQAVSVTPFDATWTAEYSKRVGQAMDIMTADKRLVVWVGLPVMDDPDFGAKMQKLNAIYKAEAAKHGVVYVDSWKLLAVNGAFSVMLPGPDGTPVAMRTNDGVHFTYAGGEYVAQAVMHVLDQIIPPAPPPTPTPSPTATASASPSLTATIAAGSAASPPASASASNTPSVTATTTP